jgi:hypothetical protein
MSTIISCFDYTTIMVQPWAKAGYTCYCVDLRHPTGEHKDGNIIKVGVDVLERWPPTEDVAIAFFFPPCTGTAVSGARWFKDKGLGALIEALTLFKRCIDMAEWADAPYMIENPVSTVSTYWRKPDYIFQPWQYGDMWTKKTCLWTGNGFIMPEPLYVMEPELVDHRKIHYASPRPERGNMRAETPPSFARAVFEANCMR